MQSREFYKLKKIIIFSFMCLLLICVNTISHFAEEVLNADVVVDIEEKKDETILEKEIVEDIGKIEDATLGEENDNNLLVDSALLEEVASSEKDDNIEEIVAEENEEKTGDETIESNEKVSDSAGDTKVIEEAEDEIATASEIEEIEEVEVATSSVISVKVFWIDSISLNDSGVSGSYNYEWDTFNVKEGEDFIAPENVIKDIEHSNCNQVYKFVGFTTEDQKTNHWLHADYAAGEKMFDKTFPVEKDMVVWAVYEAKDTYVSNIKLVDGKLTFKTTTIPNIAIKNIMISDKEFENLKDGYKVLIIGDRYIAYTKDSAEGKPILEEDVKKKFQK